MNPVVKLTGEILPTIFPTANIFAYRLQDDYEKLSKLPIMKVENVNESNTGYGSNRYSSRSYLIQVMVFLDIQKQDIEKFNDLLDRGVEEHGFFLQYADNRPHEEFKHVQVITRQYSYTKLKV
ncbi:hypothetical protein KUA55_10200 [Enterococcus sp. ALS3]|uniref:DUF3168 domain-containing protein n=1 Tax=Enterococcus alishanensis TaxID=1303817 RepID=A0ABS6TDQ4_9ENTE|nr:hypothetical protein [Enterococcus alishanensis]MBV7391053.1 hypothetical protein [Enterococcus alishanensis]